jgi:hypothetical protein
LLVEDNDLGAVDTLGAGSGAVGLLKPTSTLDTGDLIGQQYLGFVYGAGVFTTVGEPPTWSSHLVSFGFPGFPSVPTSCRSLPAGTSTTALIYGGDFINDDPTTGTNGFGNCDLAIDLEPENPANNGSYGLYPQARVWIFPATRAKL